MNGEKRNPFTTTTGLGGPASVARLFHGLWRRPAILALLVVAGVRASTGGAEGTDSPAYVMNVGASAQGACGVGIVDGWEFTANVGLDVTALGVFDGNARGPGLVGTHEVRLFNITGDVLASAIVPAGTTAELIGGSRFVAVPPITLSAGSNYILAATYCFNPTTNDDTVGGGDPSLVFDGAITFVQGRRQPFVSSFVFPPPGPAQFGPNLLFRPASTLDVAKVWVGLKNSDDQGTQFDVEVRVYSSLLDPVDHYVARGLTRCVTGVTRNPSLARQVTVNLDTPVSEPLAIRVFTRVGTNADGTKCAGPGGSHSSAVGLRLYYDSLNQPSQLADTAASAVYLHSTGSVDVVDANAPTAKTTKYKDSSSVNFPQACTADGSTGLCPYGTNQLKQIGNGWSTQ